ncbi:MAG: hypothetical protein LUG99_00555, partial [Lachnospiraceae bacterium]|nr:hypothetical protein [Lachnospiraceae bacterium]
WRNGSNAGVFNVNLNNLRSNSNSNIGFRSALPYMSDAADLRGLQPALRCKGFCIRAIIAKNKGFVTHKGTDSLGMNADSKAYFV